MKRSVTRPPKGARIVVFSSRHCASASSCWAIWRSRWSLSNCSWLIRWSATSCSARINFERAEQEVADHLISQEQFDKDHLDLQIAQQELAEAQWRLEKTTIRAPFGGRVTERFMKLGQHVRPGDQLFTVSDFDPLIAKIFLPEKDVYGLKEGRDVRITLKANEQTRFSGRIRQISPVVDTATGTVKLTIEAKEPPAEVRPGAFVTIDIVRTTHPQAVLLPREPVIRHLQDR